MLSVVPEEGYQPLSSSEDFWTIALGSRLRWTIDQMPPQSAQIVRHETLTALQAQGVDKVATNVIYAVAHRNSTPA